MVTKKHKLSLSEEDDFYLLGLVSDEPDYKLCWTFNDQLYTHFHKLDDITLYNRQIKQEQSHSIFQSDDHNKLLTFRIIRNRGENGFFLPGLKNIDYFFHIHGDMNNDELNKLIKELNSFEMIRMCVSIEHETLKDKDRLMMW